MPPSLWLVTRLSASLPKPTPVTLVENVRPKSGGVARPPPSLSQRPRMRGSKLADGLTARPCKRETGFRPMFAGKLREHRAHRLGQPHAMALSVLRPRPSELRRRLTRHLPPGINEVLAAHVGHLAGALPGQ